MKKIVLLLMCCLGIFGSVSAANVSKSMVLQVAIKACNLVSSSDFSSKKYQIEPISYQGELCYYLVQFQPEGWALVSADDQVAPIIGYSDKGVFDMEQMPDANRFWLNERVEEIKAAKKSLLQGVHPGWNGFQLRASSYDKITPLIKVEWNQTGKYAQSCPVDTKGKRAVVGCVAVAIAQALTIPQYPVQPTGEIGYNDDDMGLIKVNFDRQAPYDWKLILSREDDSKELARFLYHCGVIVQMDYSPDGSGAHTKDIPKALKNYFSFSDSVKFYSRSSYSGEWNEMILKELKAGRAVIYSGHDPDGNYGHAFNLDGFDGSKSFHVNWGWGGKNNGYYSLDHLHDGNFGYRTNHQIVVGLIPKNSTTAVEQIKESSPIEVSSPSSSIRIKVEDKGVCRVYDLSGKLVFVRDVKEGVNTFPFESKGVYFVHVQCGKLTSSFKIKK
ncbi:MAG: thiol protease/hemagglutinin PrtT [Parabacteroides sp.]|nr:thiol protease/hemagglutinin PrtT [Parabacteroides sp.]